MPIKFRCQHCRQFLGISRTRAGQLVDCPTCGRTLRVPNLDGSLDPLPEPKLDVQDAALAGALGELANIGSEGDDDEGDHQPAENVSAPVQVKELAPLPRPEPISLDPSLPAEKVDVQKEREKKELAALAAAGTEAEVKKVQDEFAQVHKILSPTSFPRVLRVPAVMASLAAVAVLALGLGWFLGGLGGGEAPAENGGGGENGGGNGEPKTVTVHQTVYHTADWKPAFKGQVMYVAGGVTKPDAGARILVLPDVDRAFQGRLPAAGLLPGLEPGKNIDQKMATGAIQAAGGNSVLADENGQFEIKLPPNAGDFVIVAISRYSTNDFETEIEANVRGTLEKYIDSPNALIKTRRFKFTRRKFDGAAVQSWNPEFE